jgi:adenylate cyclase
VTPSPRVGPGRAVGGGGRLAGLSTLIDELGRCTDLDQVLTRSLDSLAELFGFEHSLLLLLDETGGGLYTIASRGYERSGIGSEVRVGQGVIGRVAAERRPVRVNNLQRMLVYAKSALRSGDDAGRPGTDIPLPDLPAANSQLGAPAMAMGNLVGVLLVESEQLGAFNQDDEDLLAVVAHLVASAVDLQRVDRADRPAGPVEGGATGGGRASVPPGRAPSTIRFFASDGSTFVDGDYLVKGVPGRILWRLLTDHLAEGRTEFTNREVRLDPSLEMPAFRDNFESRLILLKRRLDERDAPMRIEKTGRGRFRLDVAGPLRMEPAEP